MDKWALAIMFGLWMIAAAVYFGLTLSIKRKEKKTKTTGINRDTKAILELLICEIQQCKDMSEVNSLLDSWIKPNNLHPEKVQTIAKKGVRLFYLKG